MSSYAKAPDNLALALVGQPGVGKRTLCRESYHAFPPGKGYDVHYSGVPVYITLPDIRMPPPSAICTNIYSATVGVFIMVLQPRQLDDFVKLNPLIMRNTNVVGLCYNPLNAATLDYAVNKWFPFVKYHSPSTPIVLIGCGEGSLPSTPETGRDAVSSDQLDQAVRHMDAVASINWSLRSTKPGVRTPEDVVKLLTWYGYHHAQHERNARSKQRGCIVV